MGAKTGIEWTDATWNPILGCSRVSEGCRNCYAEGIAGRFGVRPGQKGHSLGVEIDRKPTVYDGLTQIVNGRPVWTGQIKETKKLLEPLSWRSPKRVFVNSMSDLFHDNVSDEQRDKIFAVMALCPRHTFQVLTKRPAQMLTYLSARPQAIWHRKALDIDSDALTLLTAEGWPPANIWLGVSVENQAAADERIPLLLQTPAAVRFISAEPLLGPVDLDRIEVPCPPAKIGGTYSALHSEVDRPLLDWVICGGESGPGARPMHPDWARGLRDQCAAAGVPFFFKQWGEWAKELDRDIEDPDWRWDYTRVNRKDSLRILNLAGGCGFHGERVHVMHREGKKAAGSLLDGVEHKAFPAVRG